MQRELEARGLSIVGVSTQDTAEQIRNFQNDLKQDYKLLTAGGDVPTKFNNGPGLPVTYVLDRIGLSRVGAKRGPREPAQHRGLVDVLRKRGAGSLSQCAAHCIHGRVPWSPLARGVRSTVCMFLKKFV